MRGFDRAFSFGFYEGSLRGLVHLFKYSGMKPLARPLGQLLGRALFCSGICSGGCSGIDEILPFDLVVPVPLYWKKRWRRGFNQAELLAREVARGRGISVARALRRKRPTETQAGLTSAARRRNVAGAFALRPRADVKGKRILLVDDVMTTGATANACANALKRGGAKSVSLATLARVDRRWTG